MVIGAIDEDTIAFLDANVLYPMPLCDTLLHLAAHEHYLPRWSPDVLEEVRRNLVEDKRCTPEQALRRIRLMCEAFPEAETLGYEPLVESMKNDPKDRHVLAAALTAGADLIVTQNIKDFRLSEGFQSIAVVTPDQFLMGVLNGIGVQFVATTLTQQAYSLRRHRSDVATLLEKLSKVAPNFVAAMREQAPYLSQARPET